MKIISDRTGSTTTHIRHIQIDTMPVIWYNDELPNSLTESGYGVITGNAMSEKVRHERVYHYRGTGPDIPAWLEDLLGDLFARAEKVS